MENVREAIAEYTGENIGPDRLGRNGRLQFIGRFRPGGYPSFI